jgi:hypothetical protein
MTITTKITNRCITLTFLLIGITAHNQQPVEWEKTYGGKYEEKIEKCIPVAGGYLIAGWTKSKGAGDKDAWVLKLDKNGEITWQQTYGDALEDVATTLSVTKKGYLVAGSKQNTLSKNKELWLFKIDEEGKTKWERTLYSSGHDKPYKIIETEDGIVLAGQKEEKGDHDLNMWLINLTDRGLMQWQGLSKHRYYDDLALSGLRTENGDYLLVGYAKDEKGSKNAFISRFNSRGLLKWSKQYGGKQDDEAVEIFPTADGRYIVFGNTESKGNGRNDLWMFTIDNEGNSDWDQTIGNINQDIARGVIKTDKGFIVYGITNTRSKGETDYWLLGLDNNYKKTWETSLGGAKQDEATGILPTDDGFLLTGATASSGNGLTDLSLLKLNSSIESSKGITGKTGSSLGSSTTLSKGNASIIISDPIIREGFKTVINEKQVLLKGKITTQKGISSVLINGKEIMFYENGEFSSLVPLTVGDNKIGIKVVEKNNDVSEKFISIARAANLTNDDDITLEQTTGRYFALLIGVEEYSDPNINNLDKPIDDALTLYNTLTTNYTFDEENVILLKNPTRGEIIVALDQLAGRVTENDNLVIFYAGHGYWDEDKELGYWLPADATKSNTANWLRNSTIRDYVGAIKSRHTLLIADACFSGGIFKTRSAFGNTSMAVKKLYSLPSRKAMTSGTLKEVPDKSAFLEYLNKRLTQNNEKYLTSEKLFMEFRTAVLNNSSTIPQYGTIHESGDEGGEFVFIKR